MNVRRRHRVRRVPNMTYGYGDDTARNQFVMMFDREMPRFDSHQIVEVEVDGRVSFVAQLECPGVTSMTTTTTTAD
jgi:hypothetical protein